MSEIILADPPWRQSKGGLRSARPNQGRDLDYPTLGMAEIKEHIAHFSGNGESVLFLWTIDKYLHEAEALAESLGYRLHARIVRDKENGVAPAFTVRYSHEYLLWMYRGKFQPITKSVRGKFTTIIRERSTKHSKKPIAAYEMIESMYPNLTKTELYARNFRDGWISWGNELDAIDTARTRPNTAAEETR